MYSMEQVLEGLRGKKSYERKLNDERFKGKLTLEPYGTHPRLFYSRVDGQSNGNAVKTEHIVSERQLQDPKLYPQQGWTLLP